MAQMKASCSGRTLDKHAATFLLTSGCPGRPGASRAKSTNQKPDPRHSRRCSRLQRLALSATVTDVRTHPERLLERPQTEAGQEIVLLQELRAHLEQAGTVAAKVRPPLIVVLAPVVDVKEAEVCVGRAPEKAHPRAGFPTATQVCSPLLI